MYSSKTGHKTITFKGPDRLVYDLAPDTVLTLHG